MNITYHITFKVSDMHRGIIPFMEKDCSQILTSQVDVHMQEGKDFSTVQFKALEGIFPKLAVYIEKDYIKRFVVDGVTITGKEV